VAEADACRYISGPGRISLASPRRLSRAMSPILQVIIGIAVAAVAVVLILGVINMMRGNSPERSQRLMRWRVILQFTALAVILIALYFSQR
jgi:hypothetical protein